jgi:hypothetical protein
MFVNLYQIKWRVITLDVHRRYFVPRAESVGSGLCFGPQTKEDLMWEVCWSLGQCPTAPLDLINLSPQEGIEPPFGAIQTMINARDSFLCSQQPAASLMATRWLKSISSHPVSCEGPFVFFIIRKSVTVYWICSLQSLKLECFIGLRFFEPTKCTTHFIFFDSIALIFFREK